MYFSSITPLAFVVAALSSGGSLVIVMLYYDGRVVSYIPQLTELFQFVGIFAFIGLAYILGLRMLPLLPVEGKYVKEHKPETTEVGAVVLAGEPVKA